MEPVIMPIEDVLDLHTFNPKEVGDLLDDYFSACVDKGIFSVRIIHGKGKGILKKRVHSILKRHSLVISYQEASPEAGGWGATFVVLRKTP
ncbi:MAG: Smr/MutS family protein [Desulfobacterales bacterium]